LPPIAAPRCSILQVCDPSGLPEGLEEVFDMRWEHWLDGAAEWQSFFERIEGLQGTDLVETLAWLRARDQP